jgi:beta-ureidopropionase / N-carbamoyl-L-amino-acid hydrolase
VIEPDRVLADLRALADLTSDDRGAQRVAFTERWRAARAFLRERLEELPVQVREDSAQNLWARLEGEREPAVAVGSHLDSVPDGGWLDGALGTLAALEVLRSADERPPRSLVLVDWADEEGRFGHSLLGSSAASGNVDLDALRAAGAGDVVDLDGLARAASERPPLAAYLELHIEQGPVLERDGAPLAAVAGTFGVRRDRFTFRGRAAHAGATPLDARQDPVAAAARLVLAARETAAAEQGLATVGAIGARPGTPTAVASACAVTVDARHADGESLAELHAALCDAASAAAATERCGVEREALWSIDPIAFDPWLVERATRIAAELGPPHDPLRSGPLHDAAEMARAGVPTAMLFVRSRGGVSHSAEEDSDAGDLRLAVRALGGLARAALLRDGG